MVSLEHIIIPVSQSAIDSAPAERRESCTGIGRGSDLSLPVRVLPHGPPKLGPSTAAEEDSPRRLKRTIHMLINGITIRTCSRFAPLPSLQDKGCNIVIAW
jgi:hypothetical protein